MLQQVFEVTSTHFHAAMQTFVPLVDSVVDRCHWNPWKRRQLPGTITENALLPVVFLFYL